jgi:hypothetical protein
MRGARWVDRNILEQQPDDDLRVLAVWIAEAPTNDVVAAPDGILDDPRVTHLTDDKGDVPLWLGAQPELGVGTGYVWDVYLLFDDDAQLDSWTDHIVAKGGPIITDAADLEAAFTSDP